MSTTDEVECPTPTHTSISSETIRYLNMKEPTVYAGAVPWKDHLFIIRDPESKLVIALREGILGLFPQDIDPYFYGGASYWRCVEDVCMWLGFRNVISGTYIGHNDMGKFVAVARHHSTWEWFCARQHPGGGHVLLMKQKNSNSFLPMKIGGKNNRELVVSTKQEGGTAWEFIRVDPGL